MVKSRDKLALTFSMAFQIFQLWRLPWEWN